MGKGNSSKIDETNGILIKKNNLITQPPILKHIFNLYTAGPKN